jgi:hypothetical protein
MVDIFHYEFVATRLVMIHILASSILINRTVSFYGCRSFAVGQNVSHKRMQYELCHMSF